MTDDPLVTVVIDTHNYGHLIPRALESVLQQNYPAERTEILVVDDGSTDNTAEVVAAFGPRVRYLLQDNGGQASALNTGIREARGEIICLLDADDRFYPDKLRLVVDEFKGNPAVGLVYNCFDLEDAQGNPLPCPYEQVSLRGDLKSRTLLGFGSYGWITSAISMRAAVMRGIEIPEDAFRYSADYFLVSILPLITEVGVVQTPCTAWVFHGSNHLLGNGAASRNALVRACNLSVRRYAETHCGETFVTYLGLGDYGAGVPDEVRGRARLALYLSETRHIAEAEVPLVIRCRAEAKLALGLVLPATQYARVKSWRGRLRAWQMSLARRGRSHVA